MSGVQGGDFWSGFAAGCLASIASSAWQGGSSFDANGDAIKGSGWAGAGKFADSTVGLLAFGTVSGGAGASLTGGNFWQGAVTGLVVSGLNHSLHGGFNSKKTLEIDKLIENYPLDENGEQISSSDAYLGTGGDVGKFYEKEFLRTGEDPNACALRMSMAMNDAGYDISKSPSTYKGAGGKNYYLSSTGLKNYISNNYNLTSTTTTNSALSAFAGIKGIYFMQPISPAKFQASGHITIWDGNSCLGGHCYNTHPQFYSATLLH